MGVVGRLSHVYIMNEYTHGHHINNYFANVFSILVMNSLLCTPLSVLLIHVVSCIQETFTWRHLSSKYVAQTGCVTRAAGIGR